MKSAFARRDDADFTAKTGRATPVAIETPPWPYYDEKQIEACTKVLRSGKVNQWTGTLVREFERRFADYFGVPHAVAVTNGSVALELALRAFDVGPGDEVIVTSRSFIASASSVDLVGATPVFADVDFETQGLSPATVSPLINGRTKAVIPVHLNGRPCDIVGLMKLAKAHNLIVIEDCAQSHGAAVDGKLLGSFGHATAFSFCQDKIMTTGGEGGMVLFTDEAASRKAWSFKDHGKSWRLTHEPAPAGNAFRWLHDTIGTNWRMLEMQAAIGLIQLELLGGWVDRRRRIASRLAEELAKYPCVRVPKVPDTHRHAYYRFDISLNSDRLAGGWTRGEIMRALSERGIAARVPCPEIYLEKAYEGRGPAQRHGTCMRLGEVSLLLPVHPTMDDAFVDKYVGVVREVFSSASR